MKSFKNALVSVSDKTGIAEFLKPFVDRGMRIVSTGGTAKYLRDAGFNVVDVSEQTGSPEVMDGRVKTLHPKVHMALLARMNESEDLDTLKQNKLELFDLVVGNLYPFAEALAKGVKGDELIEFIDVGGPSFLRAAAKNHESVTVVCDPSDYEWLSKKDELSLQDRRRLAAKVFAHTAAYDSMIAGTLSAGEVFKDHSFGGSLVQSLRYGENPHQKAYWFKSTPSGIHQAKILQGKELSFNNLLDIEAAASAAKAIGAQSAVAVKHNNPCGVGTGRSMSEAISKMAKADPVSIFGGIVAASGELDEASARTLSELFLECIVAPSFAPAALDLFKKKKNLRVLEWDFQNDGVNEFDFKPIRGGYLVQNRDVVSGWSSEWKVLGNQPSAELKRDLVLAWQVAAFLKSNAIAIVSEGQSVGLGMGQVNRVDAVKHALTRMKDQHPNVENPVLASDGFFPFSDSIDIAALGGIKWIIQPGGSVRDEEVIKRASELNVNMIFTGQRHFRH